VWAAVTLAWGLGARSLGQVLTARGVTIAIGIALAAAVGLSRVYLRVHYLSDVSGGWALGATAFALCGMVAIVVTHLRHNESRTPAAPASQS
jgi:membrane-associated phospholipid phosphatase